MKETDKPAEGGVDPVQAAEADLAGGEEGGAGQDRALPEAAARPQTGLQRERRIVQVLIMIQTGVPARQDQGQENAGLREAADLQATGKKQLLEETRADAQVPKSAQYKGHLVDSRVS